MYIAGTLSEMPAVNTFALFATIALLIDFILQITAFIALLAIDEMRYEVRNLIRIFYVIKV